MEEILLSRYGAVIYRLLTELLLKRQKEGFSLVEEPENIPSADFFAQLAAHPLPEVVCDGENAARANEVIRFVNRTEDSVNLKRALLLLLVLSGNTSHFPFPRERYNPDLLDMRVK